MRGPQLTLCSFLNYYGYDMVSTGLGQWAPQGGYIGSSIGGSPLVLYNSSLTTLVVSPLSGFMTSLFSADSHFGPQQVVVGVNGKASSIPAGYSLTTLIVAGDGITGTMTQWGALLLKYYNKRPADIYCNHMQKYLGYVTGTQPRRRRAIRPPLHYTALHYTTRYTIAVERNTLRNATYRSAS